MIMDVDHLSVFVYNLEFWSKYTQLETIYVIRFGFPFFLIGNYWYMIRCYVSFLLIC